MNDIAPENVVIANARYMDRRARESKYLPFIFSTEYAIAIKAVSMRSGKWYADILANAIVDYGTQGENANINISDDYANLLFWELHETIADSQAKNFLHIDHNQMILVEEYHDAYRKHIENRRADPTCEQCLPFVFRGSFAEKLATFSRVDRARALRSIIDFGVQGIEPTKSRYSDTEVDDAVFKICASIRHTQEEFMDYIQRARDEETLFTEFFDDSLDESAPGEELEKLTAFLERIYDPKHNSKYNSFWFYKDYACTAYNLLGQESRRRLLHAIMCYGTEGVQGLYKISDPEVMSPFIQIKASIKASQNRYRKAKINGSKGGRPEKFPKILFIELAKRGFYSAEEIAAYLGCSPRTVERKISDEKLSRIMDAQHPLRSNRRPPPGSSSNPMKDAMLIPLLRNTGKEKFKDLDENNIRGRIHKKEEVW